MLGPSSRTINASLSARFGHVQLGARTGDSSQGYVGSSIVATASAAARGDVEFDVRDGRSALVEEVAARLK